jgi:SAM-dependent methyltransferase
MTDSPRAFFDRLGTQLLLSRCIALMAEIGIADRVADGPRTAAELASDCGVNADALMRILRFLAANGVFAADSDGAIHNTATSELLRTAPGSLRDQVRASWQDVIWQTYAELSATLRTGEPAFDRAFGLPFFDYLSAQPEIGARFAASMALMSSPENAALAAAYPFRGTVIDVAGGRGGLLAAILRAHPDVHGVLFDQASVLEDPASLLVDGQRDRVRLYSGDFFRAVPPEGDVYVLKRVLHDWPDTEALRILRSCRTVLRPDARLLVIDAVLEPGNAPDPNKMLDVGIMALTRGRERNAAEFERLFEASDLKLRRIIPPTAPSSMSIVEASL